MKARKRFLTNGLSECLSKVPVKVSTFKVAVIVDNDCLPQWRGETRAETARREKMRSARAR